MTGPSAAYYNSEYVKYISAELNIILRKKTSEC